MSLIGLINEYDRKQSAHIAYLEEQLEIERKKSNHLLNLLMSATAASERKTLELILAGHFDKFVKKDGDMTQECTDG